MEHFENLLFDYWVLAGIAFIALSILFISFASYFIRNYVHLNVLKKHHDLAGYIIATLGILYAVFLGITATNTQEQYREIHQRINKEAYLADNLIRFSAKLHESAKSQIQTGVKLYLKSVIEDEWPLLRDKKESAKTLEKFSDLWIPIYKYQVNNTEDQLWFSQCLNTLSLLNSARLERIYTSWESLGLISWFNLLMGGFTLICLLLFFGTENTRAQFLLNALFTGFVAFMIFSVFLLNQPFEPPQPLSPKAYEMVYQQHFGSID